MSLSLQQLFKMSAEPKPEHVPLLLRHIEEMRAAEADAWRRGYQAATDIITQLSAQLEQRREAVQA